MNSRLLLWILAIAILPLWILDDELLGAYYAIVLTLCFLLLYVNSAIKSMEKLMCPLSILVFFSSLYTIAGITMWAYREVNFTNWGGQFWPVLQTFTIVDYVITVYAYIYIERKGTRVLVTNSGIRIKPISFGILLILEYLGIYLFTAGFKFIPLLAADIDEERFLLGEADRPGAGIGSLLINLGILCLIDIYYSKTYKLKKIVLFIVVYIPFVLYGGRFLMIMPLVILVMLWFVQKVKSIRWKLIVKVAIGLGLAFGIMMFYGTFRKAGNDIETDLVLDFVTGDLFPEFRGSIGSFTLNKKDLTFDYWGFLLTSFFPGSITKIFGVDKSSQISIGSYVAQLLGFEGNFGIRTSFTGELLLTNPFTFIVIWGILLTIVSKLSSIYFKAKTWNYRKIVIMYLGLNLGTVIPYGISLLPNTIILIVFILIISEFIFKNGKKKRIKYQV